MTFSRTPSDRRRARLAFGAAVLLAALAGWLFTGGGLQSLTARVKSPPDTGEVGQRAPDFELESPDGQPVRLSSYGGKVVLLNFWATWCIPCRAEMPEIESAYLAHQERGFEVLAINLQEGQAEVAPFMSELRLSFPALLDRDGAVSRLYRARALPSSFLVDRQGVIRYVKVGPLTRDALEEQLQKL